MFTAICGLVATLLSYAMLAASTLTTFTKRLKIGDLVKWEVLSLYCRDAGTIKNRGSGTLAQGGLVVGMPLIYSSSQWGTLLATEEASCAGIFLGNDSDRINEPLAANAITVGKYQILVGGPAIINKSLLATADVNGVNFTMATLLTRLAALNIKTEQEPTSSALGIQTT